VLRDRKQRRRWIFITTASLFILATIIGLWLYRLIQLPNVQIDSEASTILIPTGSTYEDLVQLLRSDSLLKDERGFRKVANWMKFSDAGIKAGRYKIQSGWSNRQLISILRAGIQEPVKLVIHNVRTVEDLAGKVAPLIEPDSQSVLTYLRDSANLSRLKLTRETVLSLFIPNSYEVFWNTSPEGLVRRMLHEHDNFWKQNNRRQKAKEIGLGPAEVYTLASIVEKETQASSERSAVAGLYLNRLDKGMPLQADPTIVFAVGDFTMRRVLNKHLTVDSPYNTYRRVGLPPGPIYMPSISSIDAVLKAEKHNYLYMCARPDNSGLHAFASNLRGHNQNAARYRSWLNQRGIIK